MAERGERDGGDGLDLGGLGDVECEDAGGVGVEGGQVVDLGGVAGGGDDALAAVEQLAGQQRAEAGLGAGD